MPTPSNPTADPAVSFTDDEMLEWLHIKPEDFAGYPTAIQEQLRRLTAKHVADTIDQYAREDLNL